jgi:hypothetical protein
LITSTATPPHYTSHSPLPTSSLSATFPLHLPPSPTSELYPQNPKLQSTLGSSAIGYANNGVPFYSSLSSSNSDAVLGENPVGSPDICMGYVTSADGSPSPYHYKTAPPCLFASSDDKGQGRGVLSVPTDHPDQNYDPHNFTLAYGAWEGSDRWEGGDRSSFVHRFDTKVEGAPFPIGVAADGFLIYSPYDADGALHTGLDNCNGKYYEGTYAYVQPTTYKGGSEASQQRAKPAVSEASSERSQQRAKPAASEGAQIRCPTGAGGSEEGRGLKVQPAEKRAVVGGRPPEPPLLPARWVGAAGVGHMRGARRRAGSRARRLALVGSRSWASARGLGLALVGASRVWRFVPNAALASARAGTFPRRTSPTSSAASGPASTPPRTPTRLRCSGSQTR